MCAIINNNFIQSNSSDKNLQTFLFYPVNNKCKNCRTDFGLENEKCYYFINAKNSYSIIF